MKSAITRRSFIAQSSLAAAGTLVLPTNSFAQYIRQRPGDQLRIAFVGVGGRGANHVQMLKHEHIAAFCDVDEARAAETYRAMPEVPRFTDFRVMLDRMGRDIDAVVIATPDHTHTDPALAAMELGKHVYVEKPLTHNIGEARQLLEASRRYGVVTQMGNQGASLDCHARLAEMVQSGCIGEIYMAHVWTNRPVWPQGRPTPPGVRRVRKDLDWNLWLGPAPMRPYDPAYLPFKWRGWWDFGTGALGDMGCHLLDPAYRALQLTTPIAAEASCTTVWVGDFVEANYADSCPPSSMVKLSFGARGHLPPCDLIWYDGGIRPMRPAELGSDEPFGSWDGGILLEGTRGKILAGIYGENATLLPSSRMASYTFPAPRLPRFEGEHQHVWANACKGKGVASSPFEYAVPLTETLLMGNLAVRCFDYKQLKPGKTPGGWAPYEYPGRVRLEWDSAQMRVTNFEDANQFVSRESRAY